MGNILKHIVEWEQSGKQFGPGIDLLAKSGQTINPRIWDLITGHQAISLREGYLRAEIEKVKAGLISKAFLRKGSPIAKGPPPVKIIPLSVQKKIDADEAKRIAARKPEKNKQIGSATQAPNPILNQLSYKLRQLYQKRARLSNKLVDPGENEDLQLQNIRIIKDLAPIMVEMKSIEADINLVKKGQPPKNRNRDQYLISRKNEHYTEPQLKAMGLEQLKKLKKRLQEDRHKAAAKSRNGKKEATKVHAEQVKIIKEREIALINRLIEVKKKAK